MNDTGIALKAYSDTAITGITQNSTTIIPGKHWLSCMFR